MDEPLSNLDAQLRLQMRVEIKRLQRELAATTLYVTHDQVEAMTMADLIAVMQHGKLQQLASPAELYARPANLFVARFCGSPPMNIVDGNVADGRFEHPTGSVPLSHPASPGAAKLGFRPEHAQLVEPGTADAFAGEVYVVEPLGNETLVTVSLGGTLVNIREAADFTSAPGTRCAVRPLPQHVHLFDDETGEALGARAPVDPRPAEALTAATTQGGANERQ
jgi:multiple sugar transport system ATP-binding protein